MRKIFKMLFMVFVFTFFVDDVGALSVDKTDITLGNGNSATLSLSDNFDEEIKKIEFNFVYYSYDVTGNFLVNSNYTDVVSGIAHTITFDTPVKGNVSLGEIRVNVVSNPQVKFSSINLNNIRVTTVDHNVINQDNVTINVKVDNEVVTTEEEVSNLLDRIESDLVDIDLVSDKFLYDVVIDDDVLELDLKPIAKYDDVTLDISTQKISEINDGKIVIKATKGKVTEEYIVNVKVKEKTKVENKVSEEHKVDNSYKKTWLVLIVVFGVGLVFSLIFVRKK